MTAGEQRRDRDPVVGGRLGHDVERDDRVVGEDLVERRHDGRPPAEEGLGVVGAAGCCFPVEVADGDEVEFEESDGGQRGQPAEVAPAHRAGTDERERQPAHAPRPAGSRSSGDPSDQSASGAGYVHSGANRSVGGLTTSAMIPVANGCS